ncbi:hypothetical protein BDV27DRAFT_111365 [Aspergillus caelatus]|uniref:Uncharacterized protein n=1 Tax=Aspergillus caelatus TaxID=61420 RepID=A0A5N7A699_9EURO|nr:uncharacterized protein BDV27DRAFT_111365 [Aspergillus caelatus]KAE8364716.1 hypothetical protein BDV27DRAFT_111365 [Aspergillus caelatus]
MPNKGPKSDKNSNGTSSQPQPQPRSNRWSKHCVSANLDAHYSWFVTSDYDHAFSYVCFCPPTSEVEDEDEEWETEDSADDEPEDSVEDANPNPNPKCDGGKKCLCHKLASDHPEYPWVATRAGVRKFTNQHVHADIRCPDVFDMDVFNDFTGYGLVEVAQNLVLDFVEAEGDWKEQWAVCEAVGIAIFGDMFIPLAYVDDGDLADDTFCLFLAMFLTMLTKLESQGLLGPGSEIKNLGMVMALYLCTTSDIRAYGICEGNDDKTNKIAAFYNSDEKILAYAKKYNIELRGPCNLDSYVKDLDQVELPPAKDDPWGWAAVLKQYEKLHGRERKKPKIGGIQYDITAMSSAERRESSYNGKDPLKKSEIDKIKQGMFFQLV